MSEAKILVLDHVEHDVGIYGTPKVRFTKENPGNFITRSTHGTTNLNRKRHINMVIEFMSKLLLNDFLENPDLLKRCMSRSVISLDEQNHAYLNLFSCEDLGDVYTFNSEMFGIVIDVTDTGKNFIFSASSKKDHTVHNSVQKLLKEVNSIWSQFTKEIVIGVKCIQFTNEADNLYGYSPQKIATDILKYMPNVKDNISFGLESKTILKSFTSHENDGFKLFTMYDVDVFFRFNMSQNPNGYSNEEDRLAVTSGVTKDKVLMRSAFTSRGSAELVLRSSYNAFQLQNPNFDYEDEQNNMHRVARIIHLGLSQWAEGDFERLGKDIK